MCKCVSQSNLVWSLDCLEMQRCNPMRKVAVWSCHMNVRRKEELDGKRNLFRRNKLCVFCVIRPFIPRLVIKRPSRAIVRSTMTRTLKKLKAQWYDTRGPRVA
ncbi:uncharacterized protein LOC112463541 isoform X1 [Temnothorax curvispinosus]|uniref:Uncharacterized protein LOC112463541 isoform X1 n=1 Tax=Temnothorax curvispinosus TaxID=300111 RepID=A0A6J1QTE0_9HYME|nr:uncharacterized protein LOC112463541 isoform X1 [Temnothorax curvispinosus]